jgi:hypothetical protein
MTRESVGPIEADLARLLDAERGAAAPPAALDRIWNRVSVTVGSLASAQPGQGQGADPGRGLAPEKGWLAAHAAPVAVAAFVAGGIVGAGIHATLRAPRERVVYVERLAPSHSPPPIGPQPTTLPDGPPPSAAAPPPAMPAVPVQASSRPRLDGSSLSAERAILDGARSALTAGEAPRALSLLDDHARRFPKPQLGEEREALAIQAMVAAGRYDEARARAARFRTATPNSLFLPAIDASLASIP